MTKVTIALDACDAAGHVFISTHEADLRWLATQPRDAAKAAKFKPSRIEGFFFSYPDGSSYRYVIPNPWPQTFAERLRWLLAWFK